MKSVRTRFAPSPTGLMHIGNIRTALLNYFFAHKHNGTFVLRIEDTDPKRNFDPQAKHIIEHLSWLGLTYQEGPQVEGNYGPYFQSQRTAIHKKYLQRLIDQDFVYPCFCTSEELDAKRQRQIALKKPPRYDRACLQITSEQRQEKLSTQTPFVWRMKVDTTQKISFPDLARDDLQFDLKNFSDFPITREDGSFTFMFANCIDDIEMKITHVLRGEDHLTNTVGQVVLFKALGVELPIFWHLAILCNKEGKKLSKRDQGFSLEDLKEQGFLPEAICNYLGIIGGSFEQEILTLDQLVEAYNFENISTTSQIKYDIDKLLWINHKWIAQYELDKLVELCKPFLTQKYDLSNVSDDTISCLIKSIQTDMHTLQQSVDLLQFYFEKPTVSQDMINEIISSNHAQSLRSFVAEHQTDNWNLFFNDLKTFGQEHSIKPKELWSFIRLMVTGSAKGLSIQDLFVCLGHQEFFTRVTANN